MQSPKPNAIRAFLRSHNLTGEAAARMAYLSGGQAVRKYTGGRTPHRMSGAVWFALHAHVLLTARQIAEIEAAMESGAKAAALPAPLGDALRKGLDTRNEE